MVKVVRILGLAKFAEDGGGVTPVMKRLRFLCWSPRAKEKDSFHTRLHESDGPTTRIMNVPGLGIGRPLASFFWPNSAVGR